MENIRFKLERKNTFGQLWEVEPDIYGEPEEIAQLIFAMMAQEPLIASAVIYALIHY